MSVLVFSPLDELPQWIPLVHSRDLFRSEPVRDIAIIFRTVYTHKAAYHCFSLLIDVDKLTHESEEVIGEILNSKPVIDS